MKKVILALAFVSTLSFVSCKESTEEKVEDATEAVGNEIETAAENTADAIDSTATKVGNDIEEGAEKVEEKVEEVVK
jgi:gas vesicle protein